MTSLGAGKQDLQMAKVELLSETIIADGTAKANLLKSVVQGIPLMGSDQSFKVTENALLGHRFLFGILKSQIDANILQRICDRLAMPREYRAEFAKHFADANVIHFGFEENENGCVYKVYLEFREHLDRFIQTRAGPEEGIRLHLAFKWDANDNSKRAITEYTCYPFLDTPGILKRMSRLHEGYRDATAFETAKAIVNSAASRFVYRAPMYIEAKEEGNPRLSFNVKLYPAKLNLHEIHNYVSGLCQRYRIPSGPFESFYSKINDRILSNLSSGSDRHGRSFITIYHEPNPEALRSM
jgi:hypothetical protein